MRTLLIFIIIFILSFPCLSSVEAGEREKSGVNLAILVDVSGSFREELPALKENLNAIIPSLRSGDSLAIIIVSDNTDVAFAGKIGEDLSVLIGIPDLINEIEISRDRGTDVVGGFFWCINFLELNRSSNNTNVLICATDGLPDYHPLAYGTYAAWVAPNVLRDTTVYLAGYSNNQSRSIHSLMDKEGIVYDSVSFPELVNVLEGMRVELAARPEVLPETPVVTLDALSVATEVEEQEETLVIAKDVQVPEEVVEEPKESKPSTIAPVIERWNRIDWHKTGSVVLRWLAFAVGGVISLLLLIAIIHAIMNHESRQKKDFVMEISDIEGNIVYENTEFSIPDGVMKIIGENPHANVFFETSPSGAYFKVSLNGKHLRFLPLGNSKMELKLNGVSETIPYTGSDASVSDLPFKIKLNDKIIEFS